MTGRTRVGHDVFPDVVFPDVTARAIGTIQTVYANVEDCPRRPWTRPALATIDLAEDFMAASIGLEPGTHVYVLWWAHQARRDILQRRVTAGGDQVGVFASRGPDRPNPIGLTLAEVVSVHGAQLTVRGLDCVTGTPLLDIKPALPTEDGAWQ